MIDGQRLRALRKAKHLSGLDLSRILGLGETQILRYERGLTDPSSDVVIRLAQYFGVTTDYLLGLTDDPVNGNILFTLTVDEQQVLIQWRKLKADLLKMSE